MNNDMPSEMLLAKSIGLDGYYLEITAGKIGAGDPALYLRAPTTLEECAALRNKIAEVERRLEPERYHNKLCANCFTNEPYHQDKCHRCGYTGFVSVSTGKQPAAPQSCTPDCGLVGDTMFHRGDCPNLPQATPPFADALVLECASALSKSGPIQNEIIEAFAPLAAELTETRRDLNREMQLNCNTMAQLVPMAKERDALRQRAETAEAVIAQNDLCHNLHGKVYVRAFADGCSAEQRKLYGCAPDADERESLARKLAVAEQDLNYACTALDVAYKERDKYKQVLKEERAGLCGAVLKIAQIKSLLS